MRVQFPVRNIFPLLFFLLLAVGTMPGMMGSVHAAGYDDSLDAPDKLRKANTAIGEGRYNDAIAYLEDLLQKDAGDADVLNLLGFSYRKIYDYDTALEYYQRALAIEPRHRRANEYLGELYLETDQLLKAEERLAVLEDACGLFCKEKKQLRKAIEAYKKAR